MLDKNLMLDILMLDINVNRARSMRMRLRKRLNAWSASMLELRAAYVNCHWLGGGGGGVRSMRRKTPKNAEKHSSHARSGALLVTLSSNS